MLVLIAGITGKLGVPLARVALRRGFQVRGLGRHPDKLDSTITSQLESFVTLESYDDIPALNKAVSSVDAVICAYAPESILVMDAELLLLRAAERAGIKIFHASSWNADWRRFEWGEFEHYDVHKAFQRHVEVTSPIKPVYVFTGLFGEYLVSPWGPGMLSKDDSGTVNIHVRDDSDARWSWTTMSDSAEFSIDLLTRKEVLEGNGGYYSVKSADSSLHDIAKAYEKVKGFPVNVKDAGTVKELSDQIAQDRQKYGPRGYHHYITRLTSYLAYKGKIRVYDAETTVNGKPTMSLEDLVRVHCET